MDNVVAHKYNINSISLLFLRKLYVFTEHRTFKYGDLIKEQESKLKLKKKKVLLYCLTR